MDRVYDNPYWASGNWRTSSNAQFDIVGQPGKYIDPIIVSNTTATFGPTDGIGAFMIVNTNNVEITASNDLSLAPGDFNLKEIYDIGLKQVKVTGSTGKVYVFKRQQ